jgi:hypothetical protein
MMAPVPGVPVNVNTRIALAPDGSLVVSDGIGGARRHFQGTRPPQFLRPGFPGVAYDDITVDGTGRFFALDRVQRRIEEILPNGGGNTVFDINVVPEAPNLLAAGRDRLYLAGRDCGCVLMLETQGPRAWREVADGFRAVIALAAFDGWLAILDGGARRLYLLRDGLPRAEAGFAELGLTAPQALAIYDNRLYIADPVGRRVASFSLWQ